MPHMLLVSTQVRYGVRILVRIAREGRSLNREEIAEMEGLTKPYIFKIVSKLKAAGLVDSARGRGGGYFLTTPPEAISLGDIYEILEGPLRLAPCESPPCDQRSGCSMTETWGQISAVLGNEMSKHTIAELAARVPADSDEGSQVAQE
jgi:Rrf2 family protein